MLAVILATSISSLGASPSVSTGGVALAINTPRPEYPYEARSRHYTGSGVFICRIDIKSGRVKKVLMAKSTGHTMLDVEAMRALQRWQFMPGKLRPIREIMPNLKDPFRDQDSLAKVPVSFAMGPIPPRR
jgi:TonB family protein